MSQNNGDGHEKITINCPSCSTRFSAPAPEAEFSNNKYSSIVAASHEKLVSCFVCGQKFCIYIESALITWGAGALSEQGIREFEGSKVIKPPSDILVP